MQVAGLAGQTGRVTAGPVLSTPETRYVTLTLHNTLPFFSSSYHNRCVPVREATREEKQLYFGFLLNRLDPLQLVSLDMFEEQIFLALFQAGKSSSKSLDLGQSPLVP